MKTLTITLTVAPDNRLSACDILSSHSGISKQRIKTAMNHGAVWLKSKGGKPKRLRRSTTIPAAGDSLKLYYDDTLLSLTPPEPSCISDQYHYSVWNKPAGLLTQGTLFGDHCSLIRQVELKFQMKRMVFPVHRLDREASGVVVIAHSRKAASALSELFQTQQVEKLYQITVAGNPAKIHPAGIIELPLDGRRAVTEFECTGFDPTHNSSTVRVRLRTGRLHQIRRHFAMIGCPVLGDPKYGKGNKNSEGMKLRASSLAFVCPISQQYMKFYADGLITGDHP